MNNKIDYAENGFKEVPFNANVENIDSKCTSNYKQKEVVKELLSEANMENTACTNLTNSPLNCDQAEKSFDSLESACCKNGISVTVQEDTDVKEVQGATTMNDITSKNDFSKYNECIEVNEDSDLEDITEASRNKHSSDTEEEHYVYIKEEHEKNVPEGVDLENIASGEEVPLQYVCVQMEGDDEDCVVESTEKFQLSASVDIKQETHFFDEHNVSENTSLSENNAPLHGSLSLPAEMTTLKCIKVENQLHDGTEDQNEEAVDLPSEYFNCIEASVNTVIKNVLEQLSEWNGIKQENKFNTYSKKVQPSKRSAGEEDKPLEILKPIKCSACDYRTTRKSYLEIHFRSHTGEKPFECDQCDYRTVKKSNLDVHKKIHLAEKPLKCNDCEYRASRRSHMVRHTRCHTGEKPYECDVCEYKASQKSKLDRHRRVHTGEKPFKCFLCEYCTADETSLKRHIRRHTGEKPFKCTFCDYCASQKSKLDIHIRSHTGERPFKCPLCEYSASVKCSLNRHIRCHTGEKPFKCTLCDYCTADSRNLSNHLRLHTGEKPFKCTDCEYRGTTKNRLLEHMKACKRKLLRRLNKQNMQLKEGTSNPLPFVPPFQPVGDPPPPIAPFPPFNLNYDFLPPSNQNILPL